MDNEERYQELLALLDDLDLPAKVAPEWVRGLKGRLRKDRYVFRERRGCFNGDIYGDWIEIEGRRKPATKGRPSTRTGPAKREPFADTGVKLGDNRKRWLKERYPSQQEGVCQLIDEKMAAEASADYSADDLICESDEELAELEHRINYGYGAR